MLTIDEIRQFLDEDEGSQLKQAAKVGQRYYDGEHDILEYTMFYYNAEGELVKDEYRSNIKIPHPFFTELVDQGTQLVLSSSDDGFIKSKDPALQKWLDTYFNKNHRFKVELSETITGQQAKGFDYMFAYKKNDRLTFENADCMGVVEVEGRFTEDKKDQRIYKYMDRIDKDGNQRWKILVIDDENTYYYQQTNDGNIETDETVEMNPRPHAMYKDKAGKLFKKKIGFLPFFRLDMNKKRVSLLKAVKPLIDDYDLMASSLSNNLVDFDTPIHVVRGYPDDNLDEIQKNIKTKKLIGVGEEGGVDIKTVDVPYEARKQKLELDEKSIYRFGMGLNMAGLKDTAATTNIAIKAAYSLLEMRCNKIIDQLELFLQQLVEVVLAEINEKEGTDFQLEDVYFDFTPEIMSNSLENAQIDLTEAQKRQAEINTLLSLAERLDDETLMQLICEQLDLDYEEIKELLPDPKEAENDLDNADNDLDDIVPDDEGGAGGGVVE